MLLLNECTDASLLSLEAKTAFSNKYIAQCTNTLNELLLLCLLEYGTFC